MKKRKSHEHIRKRFTFFVYLISYKIPNMDIAGKLLNEMSMSQLVFKTRYYSRKPEMPWNFTPNLWRRKWQPTPVFMLGKSYGQRSLVGYSQSMGSQRVGHDWATSLYERKWFEVLSMLTILNILHGFNNELWS